MEKAIAVMDKQRRVYIPKGIGKGKNFEKFFVVEMPNQIVLVPIPKNPVKDLERLGKKLPDKPWSYFKNEIEKEIEKELKDEWK